MQLNILKQLSPVMNPSGFSPPVAHAGGLCEF